MKLVFDIETNHKEIKEVNTIHSIVYADVDTEDLVSIWGEEVIDGISDLFEADLLIGHNIVGYDNRVIEKLYSVPEFPEVFDTLIASRLVYPDLLSIDYGQERNQFEFVPEGLMGSHSLEAWGYRLGIKKGEYGKKENAWDKWSKDMQDYCEQDVRVTIALYKHLTEKCSVPYKALKIEQDFQYCINKQEEYGILVDKKRAEEIVASLRPKKEELLIRLREVFPTRLKSLGSFCPKVNNSKSGYRVGCELTKVEYEDFNPNSGQQVITRLMELGWVPEYFTDTSKEKYPYNPEKWTPSTKEEHIKDFDHPSVKVLVEYKQVSNVITKVAGGAKGEKAWLENIDEDGRLRHRVYAFGTNTRRCSHSPNVTQLQDNEYLPYVQPREIVIVPKGKCIVGADASALEARCLANAVNDYLFTRSILESDIHSVNQKLAGLKTRAEAKTFYYAFLYGGGDAKIGSIIGGGVSEGRAIKAKFFEALPSLKVLIDDIQSQVKTRGYIYSIDGAKVPVNKNKAYIGLNYYLQGMGAIVMKVAYAMFYKKLKGLDAHIIMFNHDEFQVECDEAIADKVGELAVQSIIEAGEFLEFNCPLDGAYKVGKTWKETH